MDGRGEAVKENARDFKLERGKEEQERSEWKIECILRMRHYGKGEEERRHEGQKARE